jgi:hypothetical protein
MRWTVVLVAEMDKGQRVEQPLLSFVRDQQVVLEHLGLTLVEGKQLLRAVQQRMVAAQVTRHGAVYRRCGHCKRKLSTKGYQRRWFRSAFGKVPIRVRRLMTCRCQGEPRRTFSSLPVSGPHGLIAPEWLYLQAKLAGLIPFARVAELLSNVLPANEGLNAETVRTRVGRVGRRLEDEKVRQWCEQRRQRCSIDTRTIVGVSWTPPSASIAATCATGIRVPSAISKRSRDGRGLLMGPAAASPSSARARSCVRITSRTPSPA